MNIMYACAFSCEMKCLSATPIRLWRSGGCCSVQPEGNDVDFKRRHVHRNAVSIRLKPACWQRHLGRSARPSPTIAFDGVLQDGRPSLCRRLIGVSVATVTSLPGHFITCFWRSHMVAAMSFRNITLFRRYPAYAVAFLNAATLPITTHKVLRNTAGLLLSLSLA